VTSRLSEHHGEWLRLFIGAQLPWILALS